MFHPPQPEPCTEYGQNGANFLEGSKKTQLISPTLARTDVFLVFTSVFLGAHPQRTQELTVHAHWENGSCMIRGPGMVGIWPSF